MDMLATPLPAYLPPVHLAQQKSAGVQASNAFAAKLDEAAAKGAAPKGLNPKAWEAAQQFESQFLTSMLQPMFETVEVDEQFGGGHGEGMFRSLLVDQYAQQMTRSGGVGIAQSVYREILKLQESHS